MSFDDPKRSMLPIWQLFILNVAVILILTLLSMHGIIPLYPEMPIGYLLLIAADVLFVWKSNRRTREIPIKGASVSLFWWISAAILTPACIATIIAYLRKPNLPLGVQAGVAVLLTGYIWFVIHRLRRSGRDQILK